jgi:hypothetical protein
MSGALLAHKGMVVDTPVHGDQGTNGNTGIGEQRLRRRHSIACHEKQVLTAIRNRFRLRHQANFSKRASPYFARCRLQRACRSDARLSVGAQR